MFCEVIGWRIPGMAGAAVGEAVVIEHRICPPGWGVAVHTLSTVMVRRGCGEVAADAIGEAGMVEIGVFPAYAGVVAQ